MTQRSLPDANASATIADRVAGLLADAAGTDVNAIAEQIGIAAARLSAALAGTRRFSSLDLALIGEHFEVTVDWLLTGQDPELRICLCRAPSWA